MLRVKKRTYSSSIYVLPAATTLALKARHSAAGLSLLSWLFPGRRAWRTEDVEPVSCRDGHEQRHVRRSLERRRQNALGGGLTGLSQETLELNRLEADQEPSLPRSPR